MTTTSLNLSANGMKKHRQSSSWLATLLILAGALMLPLVVDSTTIGDFSYFLLWTF
ncbi:ABC transporter permease, partial [Klebsiella pneumoniae]